MINSQKAIDSFLGFYQEARPSLQLNNDQDYQETVAFLEQLLEHIEDRKDDPLLPLVDLIGQRIHAYEMQQDNIRQFVMDAEGQDSSVAVLKLIMRQYHLGAADLQLEIGSKSLLSMILNGKRSLTKNHIEKLCHRFHLSPAVFFDQEAFG